MIFAAKVADLPEICHLALRVPDELGFDNLPQVNNVKVINHIVGSWEECPIFVYRETEDPDSKILGFLGVRFEQPWFSDKDVLTDYIFYVKPEHRSLKVTNALINAAKDLARLNKTGLVLTMLANSDSTSAVESLLERQKFIKTGSIMSWGV